MTPEANTPLGYYIKTGDVLSPEPPMQVAEQNYAHAVGATGTYHRTPEGGLKLYLPDSVTRTVNDRIVLVATRAGTLEEAKAKIAALVENALANRNQREV